MLSAQPAWQATLGVGVFVFGLLIGSFANVLIARIPAGASIVWPGSRCPACHAPIRWYDNIPVVSWMVLRAKCRSCGAPISLRYPVVELITGVLFLAAYQRFGLSWPFASALVLSFFLVPLTFIDLDHWLLPFELTLPGIAAGLLLAAPQGLPRLRDAAIGVAAGFVLFWLMEIVGRWAFQKEALGAGDKYLLALLGGFVTYRPLLGVVLLSSLQGSIVGLSLLALRGRAGPAPEETKDAPSVAEPPPGAEAAAPVAAKADSPPPEAAKKDEEEEDDWVPGPTNMPFGPWLAVAALEILLLGPWLARVLPPGMGFLVLGGLDSP